MSATTSASTRNDVIRVGDARRLLEQRGLKKMEGCNSRNFEIWIWPSGDPEIINYDDEDCQEFYKPDVDDVLTKQ